MIEEKHGYRAPEAVTNYIAEREYFGWRARGERAVRFGQIKKGDAVLDLCCGPGMVAKVVGETVGPSGKVVGIDISHDFISYAKTFNDSVNTSFLTGNVEQLDAFVGKQTFNVALLLASWLWINDKKGLCRQVRTHLVPNGKYVVSLSSDNLSDETTRRFYWTYRECLKKAVKQVSPVEDLTYFDALPVLDNQFTDHMISQITDCGFKLADQNETERVLTLEDKLFTYENPARTEWVGSFLPEVRFEIIKRALEETGNTIGNSSRIRRHTIYLTFESELGSDLDSAEQMR